MFSRTVARQGLLFIPLSCSNAAVDEEDRSGLQNTVLHCRLWSCASKHTGDCYKCRGGFNMSSTVKRTVGWVSMIYCFCGVVIELQQSGRSISVSMCNSDLKRPDPNKWIKVRIIFDEQYEGVTSWWKKKHTWQKMQVISDMLSEWNFQNSH